MGPRMSPIVVFSAKACTKLTPALLQVMKTDDISSLPSWGTIERRQVSGRKKSRVEESESFKCCINVSFLIEDDGEVGL